MTHNHASLDSLGLLFGTDKSSIYHDYLAFYEQFFDAYREKPLKFLEIGVFNGASLAVWENYFCNSTIIGADINPAARRFARERVKIEIIDQSNIEDLVQLALRHGPFDIIVEDGSHLWEHQITSLKTLFPFVKNGGLYVAEDLQTNYGALAASYRGVASISCVDYLKKLLDVRVADDQTDLSKEEDAFVRTYGRSMEFLAFYQRACLIKKRYRPALGVRRVAGEALVRVDDGAPVIPTELTLHVGGVGDILVASGSFRASVDSQNIQGFSLACDALPRPPMQYRARDASGTWTEWMDCGDFVGSRGRSEDLTGVSVRLVGRLRLTHNVKVVGAFRGESRLVITGDGEECIPEAGFAPLYGLQVVVTAKG